jgi:hypothetical protein
MEVVEEKMEEKESRTLCTTGELHFSLILAHCHATLPRLLLKKPFKSESFISISPQQSESFPGFIVC